MELLISSRLLSVITVGAIRSGTDDFNKTEIVPIIIPVRNFKPAVHKPYTLKHTLFPSLRRQRRSEISQKSLEAVQSAVLNGIVITSVMLYIVPSAVFRIIPAVTPRFRNLRIFLFYDLHTFSSCQYRKSSSFCAVNTVRSGSPRSPKCLTVSPSRYIPVKKST